MSGLFDLAKPSLLAEGLWKGTHIGLHFHVKSFLYPPQWCLPAAETGGMSQDPLKGLLVRRTPRPLFSLTRRILQVADLGLDK